jgi:hypothetical protein
MLNSLPFWILDFGLQNVRQALAIGINLPNPQSQLIWELAA